MFHLSLFIKHKQRMICCWLNFLSTNVKKCAFNNQHVYLEATHWWLLWWNIKIACQMCYLTIPLWSFKVYTFLVSNTCHRLSLGQYLPFFSWYTLIQVMTQNMLKITFVFFLLLFIDQTLPFPLFLLSAKLVVFTSFLSHTRLQPESLCKITV